jgi:hypothetical protein
MQSTTTTITIRPIPFATSPVFTAQEARASERRNVYLLELGRDGNVWWSREYGTAAAAIDAGRIVRSIDGVDLGAPVLAYRVSLWTIDDDGAPHYVGVVASNYAPRWN